MFLNLKNFILREGHVAEDFSKQICYMVYDFYNMGYGSSIFEEQTSHNRNVEKITSFTLDQELPDELKRQTNNLIKLDVQGSELKVLEGLKETINAFEVIILEVSMVSYNSGAPMSDEVYNYMNCLLYTSDAADE